MKINRIISMIMAFFMIVVALNSLSYKTVNAKEDNQPAFQVDFINVGQGDASLVQCDGHYMLIDGGPSKKSDLIYAYLKQRSINYLDVIVATHADADHIGGLAGALNYADVGVAYCSVDEDDTKAFKSFVKYLDKRGKTITIPQSGDSFVLGSAKVTVIGPINDSSDDNNNSIVLRIIYGETSFLFTGDSEADEENDIIDSMRTIKSTVLKVAHHGSKSSTSNAFLRAVAPEYAVISVGKDSSYGHPTEKVLQRLENAGVDVYRTDLQGHIICTSDGNRVSFTPEKNTEALTLEITDGYQNKYAETTQEEPVSRSLPEAGDQQNVTRENSVVKQIYILNTNSHVFHYPTCGSVKKMADKNKLVFEGTSDEVVSMGYKSCGNCHP